MVWHSPSRVRKKSIGFVASYFGFKDAQAADGMADGSLQRQTQFESTVPDIVVADPENPNSTKACSYAAVI
ncbi:hypothetical protein PG990_005261 [Apiospora arundinis]|uniref:Uncharacterized protein n=1 Tax=Apiospora arundinis TaxID=335852 RepID=A0ABR2J6Z8_9PEZI